MADRAKLFKSGGSQAVRLPKEYHFQDAEEVLIYRQGGRVILEPMQRSWSRRFLTLAGTAQGFPYPEEPPAAEPGPSLEWGISSTRMSASTISADDTRA